MSKLLDVYKVFEKHFGEEEAKILTEAVEELVKEKSFQLKEETKKELKEELATKRNLELVEQRFRTEIK